MASTPETVKSASSFSLKRVLLLVVPLAVASVAIAVVTARRIEREAERKGEEAMLHWFAMTSPTPRRLDATFADTDQDLVADSPAGDACVVPDPLVFSYVAGPEAETEREAWQDFVKALSTATGINVELQSFATTQEQLTALAAGKLHVTAFNTGAVPLAVASCGFVPVCTLGREDGSFGTTMRLIVPAKSPIRSIKDLKHRTIAFTTSDSNSGCKAALALLREHDLLPLRDYLWKFSGSHDASVEGVAAGRYQAAPVSSDLLERALAGGAISKESIRTIYESERFPPATIGYVHYLTPALREKIRAGCLNFDCRGTSLADPFASSGVTRFVPVSYKQGYCRPGARRL
jgi:phosphonate transport system substrate-binding protein